MGSRLKVLKTLIELIFIAMLLSACGMQSHDNLYDDAKSLSKKMDRYHMENSVSTMETNFLKLTVESSSGIDTIWLRKSTSNESIALDCNLEVVQGSAKLILVDIDGEITTLVEKKAGEKTKGFLKLKMPLIEGDNYLKLVTKEHAKYTLELKSEANFEVVEE